MASSTSPAPYLAASAVSAAVSFPFWRAATIQQAGYDGTLCASSSSSSALGRFWQAMRTPTRGALSVVVGMTWGRAAIFFGSEQGAQWLRRHGYGSTTATCLPPLFMSAYVQIASQPFVRSSVMLQGDPQVRFASTSRMPNVAVLHHLWRTRGASSWFLGVGVSLTRTVPKYVTAFVIKDLMDGVLEPVDASDRASMALRSAKKAIAAGAVGATLTNPLDVVQSQMFRTEESFSSTVRRLCREEGFGWTVRGIQRNAVASAVPIAMTIFLTDAFTSWFAMH
mmetsp:Transcript_72347/g.189604  ORF Transcript_72347/g.189604 Transcript_72347/m.189604 type:complete len:281 (+) Transcript_72347:118-960(+)